MLVPRELEVGGIFEIQLTVMALLIRKLRFRRVKELAEGTQIMHGRPRAEIKVPQYKGSILSLLALAMLILMSGYKAWSKCNQIQETRGKYPKIRSSNSNWVNH